MKPALAALRAALDLLVPPACVVCGQGLPGDAAPVCALCWHRLPGLAPPACPRCGATRTAGPGLSGGGLKGEEGCVECQAWPPGLRTAAPYRMERGASRLVHALKYDGWRRLARPMGGAMEGAARRLWREEGIPSLVPVPLSRARLRERGFNQAALLAGGLSSVTGWPVADVLARRRTGRRQAGLGRLGRSENVRSLFVHRFPASTAGSALLVDDVVTTGSTAAACAAALAEGGTHCAGVVSFARATSPLEGT